MKMKQKLLFPLIALVSLFFCYSCSKDEVSTSTGIEGIWEATHYSGEYKKEYVEVYSADNGNTIEKSIREKEQKKSWDKSLDAGKNKLSFAQNAHYTATAPDLDINIDLGLNSTYDSYTWNKTTQEITFTKGDRKVVYKATLNKNSLTLKREVKEDHVAKLAGNAESGNNNKLSNIDRLYIVEQVQLKRIK